MKPAPLILAALVSLLPSLAMSASGERIEAAFLGRWTTPCVGPNQCTMTVFDNPQAGRRFAAFKVESYDPEAVTKCGFVFPIVLNIDGQYYTETAGFTLTLTHRGDYINVDGIPADLCGLSLAGDYRELGD